MHRLSANGLAGMGKSISFIRANVSRVTVGLPSAPARAMALLTAVALLISLGACSNDEPTSSGGRPGGFARSVPVLVAEATLETLDDSVQAVGTARALQSVTLYPETAGVVTAVEFTPDAQVTEGQVLLRLDDRDQRLAVRLAEVQLADAKRTVTRFTSVNRQNTNIPESQIDTAKAAVDSALIALEQAQVDLARREIRAPFSGRVGITDIDIGDRIETSTTVTTLDDRRQLLIDFAVPEVFVGQVTPGTPVRVKLWDQAGQPLNGSIIATDSRINTSSRAFTARAAIDNSNDRFRPGMAFEITVAVNRGEYLSVPDVAVQWGADGAYLWIEQDGVATRRDVTLVRRLPNRLLIEADIAPGTPIVTEGVQAVREGVALTLLDAADLNRDARRELAQPRSNVPTSSANGG